MRAPFLSAAFERPHYQNGTMFSARQGEVFHAPERVSIGRIIAVIELADGGWLAFPERGFGALTENAPRHPSREDALRAAVARYIRDARKLSRGSQMIHLNQETVQATAAWALSLVGRERRRQGCQGPNPAAAEPLQIDMFGGAA